MNVGALLVCFLLFAAGERLWETKLSRIAIRGQKRQGWSLPALLVLHAAVLIATGVEYFLRQPAINWLVTGVGLMLFVTSSVVRLVAIRTLGKFWSLHLEIRKEHQLIREGIYSRVRHPAYSAIMLEMMAVQLVGNSYGTLAFVVCVYIPLLLVRWQREEREMIEKFGEQYVRYRQEVPAFIPWR